MDMQSNGVVVIRISRSEQGRWNVSEGDFDVPLAAFEDRESACDYASRISVGKDGTTVVLLDEAKHGIHSQQYSRNFSPLPMPGEHRT